MELRDKILIKERNKLFLYPQNNKKHPESQIDLLASNIKTFGFTTPLLIDKNDNIIAGHGRYLAARKLGMERLPCIVIDDLTENQIKALRIADNRITELAETDWGMLKTEFDDLLESGFDTDLTGFTEDDFTEYLDGLDDNEAEEDDFEVPKEAKYKIENGEVWQLGEHRLLCGDATSEADVNKLMEGKKADLLLTDPPYGIDIVGKGKVSISGDLGFKGGREIGVSMLAKAGKYKPIIGDDKPFNPTFLLDYCEKKIIFGANNFASKLPDNAHWLIWDKKCEIGADHNNFSDCELAWTNIDRKSCVIYRYLWSGLLREGDRTEELKKRIHPTQKPVGLFSAILKDYSKENDIVLDLFGGSGSTLIAAEQLNRRCFMMEIDSYYCSVILERFEKFTNKKVIKLN